MHRGSTRTCGSGDVPADELELTLAAHTRAAAARQSSRTGPRCRWSARSRRPRWPVWSWTAPFGNCVPSDGDDLVRHQVRRPGRRRLSSAMSRAGAFGWVQVFIQGVPAPGSDGAVVVSQAVAVEPMTCPPDAALNSGADLVELISCRGGRGAALGRLRHRVTGGRI
ncbi:hypothetical protein HBB16_11620 [Pseudonocardia sp. MCCB 268]|nr:hypothetical protein [Pseudonocardia cytotoxica]